MEMEIPKRDEGEIVREGVSVTRTAVADYFYFKAKTQQWCVRVPRDGGALSLHQHEIHEIPIDSSQMLKYRMRHLS